MSRLDQDTAASEAIRRMLGPFARAVLVVTPQGNFAVPIEDRYVGPALGHTGSYSKGELGFLQAVCKPETRLLVVGAHIGALAIPLAKRCRSAVAIEANPQTFELLQLNVALNNVANCRTMNKAASNRAEPIEFLLNRSNTGGSKRKPAVMLHDFVYDNPQMVKVDGAPLDDLLPNEEFDLVVMDIEGSEYFALQGMQRILASVGVLQVEFLPIHLQYVAGVSVRDFVSVIAPHFLSLFIPTKGLVVGQEQFEPALSEMYARGEADSGLVFLKQPADQVRFVKTPVEQNAVK